MPRLNHAGNRRWNGGGSSPGPVTGSRGQLALPIAHADSLNRRWHGDGARTACKPDSVRWVAPTGWPFIWDRCCQRPLAANPGVSGPSSPRIAAATPLFGIAPGGACRAAPVASRAVGSYPTVSPWPRRTGAVSSLWRFPWGCPRRALPGTVLFLESGLSSPKKSPERSVKAAIQPSARDGLRLAALPGQRESGGQGQGPPLSHGQ